jgi:uncharacterized protein (TIGR02099 family)
MRIASHNDALSLLNCMLDPISTPYPSPLLRWSAAVARWALRLMVVVWLVLVLVWLGFHFVIVPRISELRPWLQQQASDALGRPVHIEALSAQSRGLTPLITLLGVVVMDDVGQEALRLPKVQVAFSPQSLLTLGLEQVVLDQPELHLRRNPDGTLLVAGIPVRLDRPSTHDAWAEWLFAQPEWAVRGGVVHWIDAMQDLPMLTLRNVQLVQRNRGLTHSFLLEADPPTPWGRRWSARAEFKEPLLGLNTAHWRNWRGQVFVDLPELHLAAAAEYVVVEDLQVLQGHGSTRAWIDVDDGKVQAVTSDVAWRNVRVQWQSELEPLALQYINGRWGMAQRSAGVDYFTQSLQFETADGLRWPGGNVQLKTLRANRLRSAGGVLEADALDIAAIRQIAQRLPLGESLHALLQQWVVQGQLSRLQAEWQGSLEKLLSYRLQGQAKALSITRQTGAESAPTSQTTQTQGLDIDFDVTQNSGNLSLSMQQGRLDSLGWLQPSVVDVDQLQMRVDWERNARGWDVQVPQLEFSNPDVQGQLKLRWRNDQETQTATAGQPHLGQLEMQGSLERLHLPALARYLPPALLAQTSDYLSRAILTGQASAVKFKVQGDLNRFPFKQPQDGVFEIAAELDGVGFAFAPAALTPSATLPWPVLQAKAKLLLQGDELQINNASGQLVGAAELALFDTQASIKGLYDQPVVLVNAQTRGALAQALQMVNQSPLKAMLGDTLAHASGTGNAEYRFRLALPLHDPTRVSVQGEINFNRNDILLMPQIPRLTQVRGQLAFTETGFSTKNIQARALGGELRMQGGLAWGPHPQGATKANDTLRIQGTLQAAALQQLQDSMPMARLAQYASGSTPYTAVVGLRGGLVESSLTTSLLGMTLALPAPLGKSADISMPLRFENTLYTEQGAGLVVGRRYDKIALTIDKHLSVAYVRDITDARIRVRRGAIGVGLAQDESAPLPEQGVMANIQINQLHLDQWNKVLKSLQAPGAARSTSESDDSYLEYLPTTMAVRAEEVTLEDRKLHQLVIGGGREGRLWRANLDAKELSGYVEYQESTAQQAGKVYARLSRLMVEASQAQAVESLLDEQPEFIPALDIVVQDFELRGKNFGRLEIDAVNRGTQRDQVPEWRLNRLNLTMPEAKFSAVGNWSGLQAETVAPRKPVKGQDARRTVLNIVLQINDAGALLTRLGMPGVARKGNGKIEGQMAWIGSPLTLHYGSLNGNLAINVEKGQFLKAEPGIAKLVGVLSLQALPRRLTLDFKDVFSEGFSFDFLRGDVAIVAGIARTNNLQMKGVNAAVLMEGQADIAKETQSIKVVVIPEINAGTASLIATAINPMIGVSTFVAQWLLRRPLASAITQQFMIEGSWLDPKVTPIKSP